MFSRAHAQRAPVASTTATSRFSLPARPFQASAGASEGLDLATRLERSDRFGHHLEQLTAMAEEPSPESRNAPIQGVFHKGAGKPYLNLSEASWYKNLSPSEQQVADQMHADPKVSIYFSRAAAAVRGAAKLVPPPSSTPVAPTPMTGVTTPTTSTTTPAVKPSSMDQLKLDEIVPEPMDVEPDDPVKEKDPKKVKQHYQDLVLKELTEARKRYIDEPDSSDSETETGPDKARQERRRQYKASRLSAIARTFFPLDASEMAFHVNLGKKRKFDNDAQTDERQMYGKDTREDLARLGEHMKLTNLYHNPYFRRAFRKAIPKDKVKAGGSASYDSMQGKIREKLLEVIQNDHAKMNWTRQDFPDDKTWNAFQFMLKGAISNSGKEDTYHARVESGTDASGSTPKMAFHHVAWKEALQGSLSSFALTPMNLSALNDQRELINPKKIKTLESQGKALPPIGAHDKAHQSTGFRSDKKADFKRAEGGGHFKDIDVEALHYVLKPNLKPRTPKKKLYDVVPDTTASTTAPLVPTPATPAPVTPVPPPTPATPASAVTGPPPLKKQKLAPAPIPVPAPPFVFPDLSVSLGKIPPRRSARLNSKK